MFGSRKNIADVSELLRRLGSKGTIYAITLSTAIGTTPLRGEEKYSTFYSVFRTGKRRPMRFRQFEFMAEAASNKSYIVSGKIAGPSLHTTRGLLLAQERAKALQQELPGVPIHLCGNNGETFSTEDLETIRQATSYFKLADS